MPPHAGQEGVATHVCLQLLEYRCPLCIGNAVKVLLHRLYVRGIGEHRVCGGKLVLPVGPGLFNVGEGDPGGIKFRLFRLGDRRCPGGKGLVQPQIAPPFHGDQVAEPHVRQFVQNRVTAAFIEVTRHLGGEYVLVAECHAPRVFHGPHVVFGAEYLIVFAKGIGHAKVAMVPVKTLLGLLEDAFRIKMWCQGCAAVQAKRHGDRVGLILRGFRVLGQRARPTTPYLVVRPGAQRNQVGG